MLSAVEEQWNDEFQVQVKSQQKNPVLILMLTGSIVTPVLKTCNQS